MESETAELVERKRELRERLARACRAHAPEAWQVLARAVSSHLEGSEAFRSVPSIALYAALPDELPTRPVFDAARKAAKRIFLPRCGETRLEFAAVECWEDLRPGRYGVAEPEPGAQASPLEGLGLVLVPGLAFDAGGRRLGRGAGWYDRTFGSTSGSQAPLLVGLAAGFQIVDRVPSGREDRVMDAVLTEHGFLWRNTGWPQSSEASQ